MRLRNRLILVGVGVVIFVIATPILVLYARGFQIDWKNHKFVKTGALVIKSLPTKASVILNGEKQKNDTPDTIRFLLPADYDVSIQKDGYQSWSKRLPINSQFATWASRDRDFVTLFYSQPQIINKTSTNYASASADGKQIAFISDNNLSVLNPETQAINQIGDISDLQIPLTFTQALLWQNAVNVYQFFTQHQNVLPKPSQIAAASANGDYFVYLSAGQLFELNSSGSKLLDTAVVTFKLESNTVWYVLGNDLVTYNLKTDAKTIVSKDLPTSSTGSITRGENQTFLILDNILYVLNDDLEKIYDNVNFANYDLTSHRLLFSNNNEILNYLPDQKKTDLILRSVSPVSNPVLNFYTGYVFYENENKIKAIELDDRDHRNIFNIADLDQPATNFLVSNDGSTLSVFNNSEIINYKIR